MLYSDNDLLNVHGVARVLRLPVAWVKSQADSGVLPCLRIGRQRLFNIHAVKAALAERAATTTPQLQEAQPCTA
jgi:hypothetical protein